MPLQASERIRSRGKQNKDRKQQTKPPVAKSETREAARHLPSGQAGCKSKLPESVLPQDNQRTICRAAISYPSSKKQYAQNRSSYPQQIRTGSRHILWLLGKTKTYGQLTPALINEHIHPPQNAYYKKERFLSTGHPLHPTLYSLSRHIIYIAWSRTILQDLLKTSLYF